MKFNAVAVLFTIALVLGCSKGDQYLHHVVEETPEVFNFTHKLKEIQGENRVDIIIAVDNSGSMSDHQKNLATNSDLFIQEFTKNQKVLDWRMGLISNNSPEPPYIGFEVGNYLDKNTPDKVAVFNAAVGRLGTSGSEEAPWKSIQKVILAHPHWARKNAILALVIITDAEEQSSIPVNDFVQFLTQIKGSTKQVVGYGVYGPKEWGCKVSDSDWKYTGGPFEVFHALISGKTYHLCTPDFGKNLADMGKDLVKRVKSPRIALTLRPAIETIHVHYKDKDLKGGPKDQGGFWMYDFDLNAIVFHDLEFAPDENEDVVISYEEAVMARG